MSNRRVVAEVSLSAIRDNIIKIHSKQKPDSRLIAVIKANGYGHGAVPIAKALKDVDCVAGYAMATAEEAFELRNNGITKPIIILGYSYPEDYERMILEGIRPAVFKLETARQLSEAAGRIGRPADIHLKIDTGMSRIGLSCDEAGLSTAAEISKLPNVNIEGIFTHFSKADEKDKSFAYKQLKVFEGFYEECVKLHIPIKYKHCANSAAILELPETDTGLSRAGIILYGLQPSAEVDISELGLCPAMSLKSSIVYIKSLKTGSYISYGGTFQTTRETTVATVPVGYADGYPRTLSNKGYVLIHGKKAPILGRVCMDQMMVDITDIPGVKEYEEVVLLGNQGEESITAEELGELSGRFNYELVCDISERVPRVYTGLV